MICSHISPFPLNRLIKIENIGIAKNKLRATISNVHLLKSLLKCFIFKNIFLFDGLAYGHLTSSNRITAFLLSSPSLVKDSLSSLNSPQDFNNSEDFASLLTGYS